MLGRLTVRTIKECYHNGGGVGTGDRHVQWATCNLAPRQGRHVAVAIDHRDSRGCARMHDRSTASACCSEEGARRVKCKTCRWLHGRSHTSCYTSHKELLHHRHHVGLAFVVLVHLFLLDGGLKIIYE